MAKCFSYIKRPVLAFILLLSVLLLGTGCMRITKGNFQISILGGPAHNHYISPPDRLFFGTRSNLQHFHDSNLFICGILIVDLPAELVADIVMLPVDTYGYVKYNSHLPQNILVEKNKLDKLKQRLEAGEAPTYDAVSVAVSANNMEAFKLLARFGAPVPLSLYSGDSMFVHHKEMVIYALENNFGINDEISKNNALAYWFERLVKESDNWSEESQKEFVDMAQLLLDKGFPINSHKYYGSLKHPLDYALKTTCLSAENKARVLELLNSHGAMTYHDYAIQNELPHLKTEGLVIDPRFKPVIEMLEESTEQGKFHLSVNYPGISGSVLVVDVPEERPQIKVHRRLPNGAWNQQSEDFVFPSGTRMIFTQPGVYVPTLLTPDLPQSVLTEQRISYKDFEVTLQRPGLLCNSLKNKYFEDLEHYFVRFPTFPINPDGKYPKWEIRRPKDRNEYELKLIGMHEAFDISPADEKWLNAANRLTQEAGIDGKWLRVQRRDSSISYAFTNHQRFFGIQHDDDLPIPYPGEIICLWSENNLRASKTELKNHIFKSVRQTLKHTSKNGISYWNDCDYLGSHILFEDSVPKEKLEEFIKLFQNLILETR